MTYVYKFVTNCLIFLTKMDQFVYFTQKYPCIV